LVAAVATLQHGRHEGAEDERAPQIPFLEEIKLSMVKFGRYKN
jgi:hypothetical protein